MTPLNTIIEEETCRIADEYEAIFIDANAKGSFELFKNDLTTAMQRAGEVRFVDGMIAATEWLIDNGHLKAGKELNELMLKALVGKGADTSNTGKEQVNTLHIDRQEERERIWLQANKLPIHEGRADLISLVDLYDVVYHSEPDQDKQ